jgi:EAL domain-containing protein (putative c-di-GMP-specific phosphodiesterase class I)
MPWYLDDFEYKTVKKLFVSVALIFSATSTLGFFQSLSMFGSSDGNIILACRMAGIIINIVAIGIIYFLTIKDRAWLLPAGVALVLLNYILSRMATFLMAGTPDLAALTTLYYPSFLLLLGLFVRKIWPVVILELVILGQFLVSFVLFPGLLYSRELAAGIYPTTTIIAVASGLVPSLLIMHLVLAIHFQLFANLKKKQQFLENLAYHDQETGMPNMMELERIGATHIAGLTMDKEVYLLASIRLARLEELRERVGHANTVNWIIRFVNELNAELQRLSSSKNGFHSCIPLQAYRLDHEVIAYPLLIPIENAPSTDITILFANAVETVLIETHSESLVDFYGSLVACTVDAETIQGMIKNTYSIVRHSSPDCRSRFTPFNTDEYTKYLRKEHLQEQMQSTSFEREIRAIFQPKVEIETGKCVGFEALARWKNPILGNVPPSEFIPLAEQTKTIRMLTWRIIEDTCRFAEKIREAKRIARISFNLSPSLFTKQTLGELADFIDSKKLGLALEIEITEGILLKLTAETETEIARLKELGVHFSIDDFGTGYSNISSLQNFEAEVIKIDKCFIDNIPGDEKSTSLVRTILILGQSLSMTTVAEGVETIEQRDFLANLKCDQIQGYLYSKPLETDEALAFLTSH